MSDLGNTIRQRRHHLGLSQEELAGRAEMDRSYVSEIESGRKNISIVALFRIARALEIEPHKIVATVVRRSNGIL